MTVPKYTNHFDVQCEVITIQWVIVSCGGALLYNTKLEQIFVPAGPKIQFLQHGSVSICSFFFFCCLPLIQNFVLTPQTFEIVRACPDSCGVGLCEIVENKMGKSVFCSPVCLTKRFSSAKSKKREAVQQQSLPDNVFDCLSGAVADASICYRSRKLNRYMFMRYILHVTGGL